GLAVDGRRQRLVDGTTLVDRVAQHVHDAAQRGLAHGHGDGRFGVAHQHAATQTVGGAQGDGAHHAVTELLLDFQREGRAFHLQRVVHARHLVAREFHVHNGADALDDLALHLRHDVYLLFSLNSEGRGPYTAAAPATSSDSSLVIDRKSTRLNSSHVKSSY